jgi:type II secretory ATPase GspE/PulE/Tfp pilus assembly ATPase PilB-like protein
MQNQTNLKDVGLDQFLDLLVKSTVIPQNEIAGFRLKYQTSEDLFEALDGSKMYSNDKLTEVYAKLKNIPFIRLQVIDAGAMELVDKQMSLKFGFIPFHLDEPTKALQVAITNPLKFKVLNLDAVRDLEARIGYKLEFFIASREQVEALIGQGQIEKIDLTNIKIEPELLRKIPHDLAIKYQAVIFRKNTDGSFDLASSNPTDHKLKELIEFLQKSTSIKINVFFSPPESINRVLDITPKEEKEAQVKVTQEVPESDSILKPEKPEKSEEAQDKALNLPKKEPVVSEDAKTDDKEEPKVEIAQGMEESNLEKFLGKSEITDADIKTYANSDQVPQLVAGVLFMAVLDRASDVHIEPYEKDVRIRFRVDGQLTDAAILPPGMIPNIVARIKILSKLKLDEQRVPQDGRFEITVKTNVIDIRVSSLPTVFGEKIVMRLLNKSQSLDKLEDLGLGEIGYDRIIEAINKPYGVILATGPTGSGKSTTLYSILTRLNKPEVNIITLEDPVEYQLPGINQVQVQPQIGFGFAEGLRSVLRQDPNIIMVGEIRDKETAELTTHAALTGHLVLSTLHTNDAAGALPRLYNLGIEPFLLTSAINAIMGQRLVRKICQKCKEEITIPQSVVFEITKELEKLNLSMPMKFFRGKGCSECKNGFSGRIGIFEVLTVSKEIEDMVLTKKSSDDIFNEAIRSGMITMRQDGFIKVLKGLTTVDEVMRATGQVKEG